MAESKSPGALAGASGAGKPSHATAAGFPTITSHDGRDNALAHHLAPFAALDPATLAGLGLVAARLWGAVA
jgi:hypothetical protein